MDKRDKRYEEIRANLRKQNLAADFFNIMLMARSVKSKDSKKYMKHYVSFQIHLYESCFAFAKYYVYKFRPAGIFFDVEIIKDVRSAIFLLVVQNFNTVINARDPNRAMFDYISDNISEIMGSNAASLQQPAGNKMQKTRSGRIRLNNYVGGLTINFTTNSRCRFVSLDSVDENGVTLLEKLEVQKVKIAHGGINEEHKNLIKSVLFEGRGPTAVNILKCVFNLNTQEYHYTFAGIAKKYNCTRQYVHKIYKEAISKIKANKELEKILKSMNQNKAVNDG